MELEGCRTHSTSAFKPSSASRTTRDEVVRLPIYGRNSKEAVQAPLPATSWVHRAKQAVRKGGSSKDEPKASSASAGAPFRSMLAFRSALMPTWCLIRLAPAFRSVFRFDWCSVSTVAFAHLVPLIRLALMPTWCSCSTRCSRETAAAHTVHGPRELIPHGKNRTACMISGPPTRNRAFAGKILTLCIPNRLIASRNACME